MVPDALADGSVTGQLQLDLTGENAGDAVSVSVPVTSSMTRPVDEPLLWALVAAFIALSLIVPLALLSLANWWIGRFRLTMLSRVASIPVTVTEAGIEPRRRDSATLIDADDFHPVGEGTVVRQGTVRKRAFNTQGVNFAHAFPWPLSDPTAYAGASPGEIVLSGTHPYTDPSGSRAPVLTALEQCWVLIVDPATVTKAEAEGRIVFVNEETEVTGVRENIAARDKMLLGFRDWKGVWGQLSSAAEAAAPPLPSPTGKTSTGDLSEDLPPGPTIVDHAEDEAGLPRWTPTGSAAGVSSSGARGRFGWLRRKGGQDPARLASSGLPVDPPPGRERPETPADDPLPPAPSRDD